MFQRPVLLLQELRRGVRSGRAWRGLGPGVWAGGVRQQGCGGRDGGRDVGGGGGVRGWGGDESGGGLRLRGERAGWREDGLL